MAGRAQGRGRGRGGGSRGGPRGGGPALGLSGAGGRTVAATQQTLPSQNVETTGVKRTTFGTTGRVVPIFVNSFACTIPESIIHHYDVVIMPAEKSLPARMNMELIKQLQQEVAPQIFTPRVVYDGRKNVFAIRELPFGPEGSKEFNVPLSDRPAETGGRAPKVFKIRLTHVAKINPEVLKRFIEGKQSSDNAVLTAITALNVVIRMEPSLNYPFNVRSFFTSRETKDIGSGLQLWRGYFQSVRPASGRMLINVDISTGAMYKAGPLIQVCLEYVGRTGGPNVLAPKRGFPDRERLRLQRFLSGIRVLTTSQGPNGPVQTLRVVKKLSTAGASDLTFTMREGGSMTVADYFRKTLNRPLQFPDVICVEVGSGALIPLELCKVPPGQIMRKQVPAEKTKDVLEFATRRPQARLDSIKNGLEVLAYGQSEYVRQFGMSVDHAQGPLRINARVLNPPTLKYGRASKETTIVPRNGSWNMLGKKFYQPVEVKLWMVVVYEHQRRFPLQAAKEMIQGLMSACREVGIIMPDTNHIFYENSQGNIVQQLRQAGATVAKAHGQGPPSLVVVVLPEGGNDLYTAVKHFGDVSVGVATQCLKSSKCFRAKSQYFANVCLKLNVKLGGINTIPDHSSATILDNTIIMGADVVHPAPGSDGRPSFTALVGNVDSAVAKYIAQSCVQTSRQEIIEDLQSMSKHILSMYKSYHELVEKKPEGACTPKRIIFYRDGVSEGQFQQVLDSELPLLKKACAELQINPKITVIVVGKRHHIRFFPQNEKDADKSGNCMAGTVVDQSITHPTEFDFYLQSHGGLLGTSRPAHYSILYDDNNFSADALQSLSFTLCHVYARSTRSVSIPAPVYYADIVCARAKNHYEPGGDEALDFSETETSMTQNQANTSLETYRRLYKPVHKAISHHMYFS